MPLVPPARPITRREGLLAATLALPVGVLAACSSADAPATADSSAGSGAGSAAAVDAGSLTDEVAADEAALIARYDAALAAVPETDAHHALLAGIRDQHAAHLDSLGASTDRPAPSTAAAPLPTAIDGLLTALAREEHAAARSRIRACEAAPDATLARLLTFIAASESSHAAELRRARA